LIGLLQKGSKTTLVGYKGIYRQL